MAITKTLLYFCWNKTAIISVLYCSDEKKYKYNNSSKRTKTPEIENILFDKLRWVLCLSGVRFSMDTKHWKDIIFGEMMRWYKKNKRVMRQLLVNKFCVVIFRFFLCLDFIRISLWWVNINLFLSILWGGNTILIIIFVKQSSGWI